MKLHQVLYRELLAVARELDRHAAFRALISSNMLVRPVVGESKTRLPHVEVFNRYLLEFLDNRSYYLPSRDRKSVQSIVRAKFRSAPVASAQQEIDTAFVALKALNDRLAFATRVGVLHSGNRATGTSSANAAAVANSNPTIRPREPLKRRASNTHIKPRKMSADDVSIARALREEAVESSRSAIKVQQAEQITTGTFLLSHPLLNGIFSRSVILLTEHSSKGTRGFIVNRPTKTPLVKAFKVHPRIAKAFGESKVRKGGPLRTDYAEIFHGRAELGGNRVVSSNFADGADLFQGVELDVAAEAVENNKLKHTDLVFINGVSSWTPGQLDGEMDRGTWVAVKAPLAVAINAKKDLWSELMGKLGGEYEQLSRMPEVDDSDEFDDHSDDDDEYDSDGDIHMEEEFDDDEFD